MEKYQLEAVANMLKALGANEPFNEDYSSFTDEGLIAWNKLEDFMADAIEAGLVNDDDYFDAVIGVKEYFGMYDEEE